MNYFEKILKTIILRTNRGDDVLVTKNSGSLILIPQQQGEKIIQIELLRNTMLFVKSNQYIKKGYKQYTKDLKKRCKLPEMIKIK